MIQRTIAIACLLSAAIGLHRCKAADLSPEAIADLRALRAEVEYLGGRMEMRTEGDQELLAIRFIICSVNDRDLKRLRPLLERSPFPVCLDMSSCGEYTGAGLDHLAGLATIHELELGTSGSEGRDLKVVQTLPNFRSLIIRDNYLKGPELAPIAKATKLRRLSLSGTDLTSEYIPFLKSLTEMEEFEVLTLRSGITDEHLAAMKGMTKLRKLRIGPGNVTDQGMGHVANFINLRELTVIGDDVTAEGLKALAALKKLEVLSVVRCPAMRKEGLAIVKGLPELRSLQIVAEGVPNKAALSDLKGLTKLKELRLSDADDETLAALAGLTSLDELYVSFTDVGDEGLKHLAGLTNLRTLALERTKVTDAGLKHLAGLGKLQYLILSKTAITDEGLHALAGLKDLQVLQLDECRIEGPGFRHLTGLKKLRELWVDDSPVVDTAAPALKELTGLTYLRLGKTKMGKGTVLDIMTALPEAFVSAAGVPDPRQPVRKELPKDLSAVPADFTFTAEEFHAKCPKDMKKLEREYRTKLVEVTGEIEFYAKRIRGSSYVSLRVDDKSRGILCELREPEPWAKYSVGQKVTLKGVFPEYGTEAGLDRCVVIKAEPTDRPKLTADELAKDCGSLGGAAAHKKYVGRFIELSGVVAANGETEAGAPLLTLKTDGKFKVEAVMATSAEGWAAGRDEGISVVVYGCVRRVTPDGVGLSLCLPVTKK